MIFVTLGSQKFQFNRLLIEIDKLVENGTIVEKVFAQTGYSDYVPKNYAFQKFLDREEFAAMEAEADIVVTHGGTGAIIGAVKKGKKVIAVPRLARFGEHVDNHQLQIIDQFRTQDILCGLDDCEQLKDGLAYVKNHTFCKYQSSTKVIIESIDNFLSEGRKE